jgi:hypothetical protein
MKTLNIALTFLLTLGTGIGLEAADSLLLRNSDGLFLLDDSGMRKLKIPVPSGGMSRIYLEKSSNLIITHEENENRTITVTDILKNETFSVKGAADDGVKILRNYVRYFPKDKEFLFEEHYRNGDGVLYLEENQKRTNIAFPGMNSKRFFLGDVNEDKKICFIYNPHWTMAKDNKKSSEYFVGVLESDKKYLYCSSHLNSVPDKIMAAGNFYHVQITNSGKNVVFLTEANVYKKENRKSFFVFNYDFEKKKLSKVGEISNLIKTSRYFNRGAPIIHVFRNTEYIFYTIDTVDNYIMNKKWQIMNILNGDIKDITLPDDESLVEFFPEGTGSNSHETGLHSFQNSIVTAKWLKYDTAKREVSFELYLRTIPDFKKSHTFYYKGSSIGNAVSVDDSIFSNIEKDDEAAIGR